MVRLTRVALCGTLVKKSKARLAPSELTTVEKANYYMKEALKDGYVHDALVDTTTWRRSELMCFF